mgnify:CR=1 FL=1
MKKFISLEYGFEKDTEPTYDDHQKGENWVSWESCTKKQLWERIQELVQEIQDKKIQNINTDILETQINIMI